MKPHLMAAAVSALVLWQTAGTPAKSASADDFQSRLHIEDAWAITRGTGVLVGVVDLGFDFFHPALKESLAPGYFAPGVHHLPAPALIAHGTAIAGVIGARATGIDSASGLAPECRLLAASRGMPEHTLMRISTELKARGVVEPAAIQRELLAKRELVQGFGTTWLQHTGVSTAEGIRYLVNRGARVIAIAEYLPVHLLSRSPEALRQVESAFQYAAAHDVVIVIGAGNDDARVDAYPGTADTVIVAGAASGDSRWRESRAGRTQGTNYGPRLSVLAPASGIRIPTPHEPSFYTWLDSPVGPVAETFPGAYRVEPTGATSLATAVTASLATLVRAANPSLPAPEVVKIIQRSARDLGPSGRDDETGWGVVEFAPAVADAAREGRE